jgi:hypothetical protein
MYLKQPLLMVWLCEGLGPRGWGDYKYDRLCHPCCQWWWQHWHRLAQYISIPFAFVSTKHPRMEAALEKHVRVVSGSS